MTFGKQTSTHSNVLSREAGRDLQWRMDPRLRPIHQMTGDINSLINYERLNPSIKTTLGNDSKLTATHQGSASAEEHKLNPFTFQG